MSGPLEDKLARFLADLPVHRQLSESNPVGPGRVEIQGRTLIDFSSNDYLGLAWHPGLRERPLAEGQAAGAMASRLLTGNHPLYTRIEDRLARLKRVPAALVMNTGFTANSTVLAALLDQRLHGGKRDNTHILVYADRDVHASILFGLQAAGVRIRRYRHNDLDHLSTLLAADQDPEIFRMVITESVFSMDGDRADLNGLRQLAARFRALLFIDEAHATGALGPGGAGLSVGAGEESRAEELVTGTFGKALGCFGAFVAGKLQISLAGVLKGV